MLLTTEELFEVEALAQDLHMHTVYSDGVRTAEEMVESGIRAGLVRMGISDHSYTDFDESYCMRAGAVPAYQAEIRALAEKYAGQITVLCGIEQDLNAGKAADGFDYVIGSTHYLEVPIAHADLLPDYVSPDGTRCFAPVDEPPELLGPIVDACFGGDYLAYAEEYYRVEAQLIERTGATIIGHFDLVMKFNEGGQLFDEDDPRYVVAWQRCADELLKTGVPFEINTGAVRKGLRSVPYPSKPIYAYLRDRGARFILSSDSHDLLIPRG